MRTDKHSEGSSSGPRLVSTKRQSSGRLEETGSRCGSLALASLFRRGCWLKRKNPRTFGTLGRMDGRDGEAGGEVVGAVSGGGLGGGGEGG